MANIRVLKQKLAHLRENYDLSGDNYEYELAQHEFKVGPCLTVQQIQEFESKYQITFPEDFRHFLLEVGDGGAGPAYGLYSLEQAMQQSLARINIGAEFLSKPFPHTRAWLSTNCDDIDRFMLEVGMSYHVQGALRIADFGCGIDYLLIVSGSERGNIWLDDRHSDNGVWPLSIINGKVNYEEDNETRVDFFTWYNDWLDENINKLALQK